MMSQAVIVVVVISLLCPSVSPTCARLEKSCTRVNFPANFTKFDDVRNYLQLCSSPTITSLVLPPKFIIEPSNQIAGSTDTAMFHCSVTSSTNYQPMFRWEYNGTKVAPGDKFEIINDVTSSTLRVLNVTESEGVYRCIVSSEQAGYSISSRYGHLEVQRCSGWKDTILPPSFSNNNNTVNVAISKGGSTILECLPSTLLSPGYYYLWLKDLKASGIHDKNLVQLPNGGLLIRNFDPPPGGVVNYRCIITTTDCPLGLVRDFYLRVSEDNEPSTVAPTNQTSLLGASISLYCITNSKGPNTWFKDGQPLLDSNINATLFGLSNEVLVLSNVTMDMDGEYSCVAGDRFSRTAHLTVLAPPTSVRIEVTDRPSTNDTILLSPSDSQNLTLTCLTDSQSRNTDVTFQWFFRGEQITTTHSMGVAFAGDGSMLIVAGTNVYGSIQCVASNEAGSVAALISVYQDKPNPPSSLSLSLDRDTEAKRPKKSYLYNLLVNPPEVNFNHFVGYQVEAYVYKTGNNYYNKCTCNLTEYGRVGTFPFVANEYLDQKVYFRVATISSTGGKSDFLPYNSGSGNDCGTKIVQVAPPSPTNLHVQWDQTKAGNDWIMNVSWEGPTEEQYPDMITNLSVDCEGREPENHNHLHRSGSQQLDPLPACTLCNWTVTFSNLDGTLSSNETQQIRTRAIMPFPILNNVTRSGSDGKTFAVNFTLPHTNTCVASQYRVLSSDKIIVLGFGDLDTCTKDSSQHTTDRYQCMLTFNECWQTLNVSVKVGDKDGDWPFDWSEPSTFVPLEGLTEDDLAGFSQLTVQSTTTSMTVSPQITDGIYCLLNSPPSNARAELCISANVPCQSINSSPQPYTFRGLTPGTNYTVTAVLSVDGFENRTLNLTQATEPETPTTAQSQVTSSSEGTKRIVVEIALTLSAALGLTLLVFLVCCCCAIRKHRRKNLGNGYRRTLLHESNEQLNDEDLVSIGPDGAPSVHSEHTDLQYLLSENTRKKVEEYLQTVDPKLGAQEDCDPGHTQGGSEVETVAEIHLMEEGLEVTSGRKTKRSKSHKRGKRKGGKGKEDVEPLIEENEELNVTVTIRDPPYVKDGIRDEVWKEHLQKSPLEAEAVKALSPTLPHPPQLEGQDIGLHPFSGAYQLTESTEELITEALSSTSGFICREAEVETPLITSNRGAVSIPMLTPEANADSGYVMEHNGTVMNCRPQTAESGYIIDHNTVTRPQPLPVDTGYIMEHNTACPQHNEIALGLSEATLSTRTDSLGYVPNCTHLITQPQSQYVQDTSGNGGQSSSSQGYVSLPEQSEADLNSNFSTTEPHSPSRMQYVLEASYNDHSSSQGYSSLPDRSLATQNSTENLSQDSSVFDDTFNTSLPLASTCQQPRRTASSGVFSTSSDALSEASGFSVPEGRDSNTPDPYSTRHTRSPSEGYASARATPASLERHFDYTQLPASSMQSSTVGDLTGKELCSRDVFDAKTSGQDWNTLSSNQPNRKASEISHTRTSSTQLIPSQTSYSTIPTLLPQTRSVTSQLPSENDHMNTNGTRSLEDYVNTEGLDLNSIKLELDVLMKASAIKQ